MLKNFFFTFAKTSKSLTHNINNCKFKKLYKTDGIEPPYPNQAHKGNSIKKHQNIINLMAV